MIESRRNNADAALRKSLAGCRSCDYDEAEGGLVNHCDACCRRVTAAAWEFVAAQDALARSYGATLSGGSDK